MDVDALKRTWGMATAIGDDAPLFFYSHLFLTHPEVRDMFPVSMSGQRDKLFAALGHIVANVDKLDNVTEYIQQLGSDHRRFAVKPEHYSYVGSSLLATLQHFLGTEWTEEIASDWATAYGLIAKVMVIAAEDASDTEPAWWDGEVTSADRRSIDVSVIRVKLKQPMAFVAGQSMAVEMGRLPRLWRYVSPANAPRADDTLEFHIQLVPGGQFSSTAVRRLTAGDSIRLGAPLGTQLDVSQDPQDLLLIAGGTGLAPLSAILDEVHQQWRETGSGRRIDLFHGARVPWNLYDNDKLVALANEEWFNYHPVVSDDPTYFGLKGLVGTAAAKLQQWSGRTAIVCGSAGMVSHSVGELVAAGFPEQNIKFEDFSSPDKTVAEDSATTKLGYV